VVDTGDARRRTGCAPPWLIRTLLYTRPLLLLLIYCRLLGGGGAERRSKNTLCIVVWRLQAARRCCRATASHTDGGGGRHDWQQQHASRLWTRGRRRRAARSIAQGLCQRTVAPGIRHVDVAAARRGVVRQRSAAAPLLAVGVCLSACRQRRALQRAGVRRRHATVERRRQADGRRRQRRSASPHVAALPGRLCRRRLPNDGMLTRLRSPAAAHLLCSGVVRRRRRMQRSRSLHRRRPVPLLAWLHRARLRRVQLPFCGQLQLSRRVHRSQRVSM
jgi:hypothetical protein